MHCAGVALGDLGLALDARSRPPGDACTRGSSRRRRRRSSRTARSRGRRRARAAAARASRSPRTSRSVSRRSSGQRVRTIMQPSSFVRSSSPGPATNARPAAAAYHRSDGHLPGSRRDLAPAATRSSRRCCRTSRRMPATRRASTLPGAARARASTRRVRRSRGSSAHSRARSCSPAAAPRPTTWRSRESAWAATARGRHLVTTAVEHKAVLNTVAILERSRLRGHPPARGPIRPRRPGRRRRGAHRAHDARERHGRQQRGRDASADRRDRRDRARARARASTWTRSSWRRTSRSTSTPGRPTSSASRRTSSAGRRASARSSSGAARSSCRSCRAARRNGSGGPGPRTWPASSGSRRAFAPGPRRPRAEADRLRELSRRLRSGLKSSTA